MSTPLSVEKALAGRRILFTGASGFLGKVWLSMMLDKVPDVGRIYVLLRGKKGQGARERFERMVNESYAFKPLHDRHGAELSRFPAVSATAGISIARRHPHSLDDDPAAFGPHVAPGASPGAPNEL